MSDPISSVNASTFAVSPFKPGERTLSEIMADLSKPLPKRHLSTKKIQGQSLTFISWYRAVKILDYYAPGWTGEVVRIYTAETPQKRKVKKKEGGYTYIDEPGTLFLVYRITIPCSDGHFYREATGSESLVVAGYGDASSNAESMSFRRAAAKFGLGLYLYEGDT